MIFGDTSEDESYAEDRVNHQESEPFIADEEQGRSRLQENLEEV